MYYRYKLNNFTNRIILILLLNLNINNIVFNFNLNDFYKRDKINEEELMIISDGYAKKNLARNLIVLYQKYPSKFENLDLSKAYFLSGYKLYTNFNYNLALPCFINGFSIFKDSPYKFLNSYFASRILYSQDRRDSALFYINRSIELFNENNTKIYSNYFFGKDIKEDINKLKRKIKWEYISKFEGLKDDSISAIKFDGDDIWIGTWSGGVTRYTRSKDVIVNFLAGKYSNLTSNLVRDVLPLKDKVFVGTFDGLFIYDKRTSKWSEERLFKNKRIKTIRYLNDRVFITMLYGGIYSYDNDNDKWEAFIERVLNATDIIFFKDKYYIATLEDGIFVYESGKLKNITNNISIKSLEIFNNKIYAGTYGEGVLIIDPQYNNIKKIDFSKFNKGNIFVESLKATDNLLIIGTLGQGVYFFSNDNGIFKHISILDGLPSNDVVKITIERDKIWFGTLSGGIGIYYTENFNDL